MNTLRQQLFSRRATASVVAPNLEKTTGLPLEREPRSPRAERWIITGWVLIALKCGLLWWAINAYQVPIHPLWLVVPTVGFGLLATALYIWRD